MGSISRKHSVVACLLAAGSLSVYGLVAGMPSISGVSNKIGPASAPLIGSSAAPVSARPQLEALGKMPMHFEPVSNADDNSQFVSRGLGYAAQLSAEGTRLRLNYSEADTTSSAAQAGPQPQSLVAQAPANATRKSAELHLQLLGSNKQAALSAQAPQSSHSNYLVGNDKSQWRRNVAHYDRVKAEAVYPGIDLVYYGTGEKLEYDFVVAPGANPDVIAFRYEGASSQALNQQGDLVLKIAGGDLVQHKPVVYQELDGGKKQMIDGGYRLMPDQSIRFELAAYDTGRALVIDPVLSYSAYLGGSGNDQALAIAVDGLGFAYITGFTESTDFKTEGGMPGESVNIISTDVFIAKINITASALVYSTYLGGSSTDKAHAIAVDSSGNAYVAGETSSNNFNIVNGIPGEALNGASDSFIAKLNTAGNDLTYSTYLGGSAGDVATGIAVDSARNAYVTGVTASTDFNVLGGLTVVVTGVESFVAKLNPAGNGLVYSALLGGNGSDQANAIAVDAAGSAYVAGTTTSTNLTIVGGIPDKVASGASDGFVAKLNPAGSALVYSTYLGGNGADLINGLAVDTTGAAYLTGTTNSTDFNVVAGGLAIGIAGETASGNSDAFIAKLNPAGNALAYSTYLGGSADDVAYGIALDSDRNAYVAGITTSANFNVVAGLEGEAANGAADAFVAKLNPDGNTLVYSTYLGGSGIEQANGIAVDPAGNAYVTGFTASTDFNTLFGFGGKGLGNDAFVTKIANVPNKVTLQFARSTESVSEDGGQLKINVSRTVSSAGAVSVDYSTTSGTATANQDYTSTSGTLNWADGDSGFKVISIDIKPDITPEQDEKFTVALSNPSANAQLGAPSVSTVTIPANDLSPGVLQLSAATYTVNEAAGTVTIVVNRTGGSNGPVSVLVATANGTATAGSDYAETTGTLTFASGETSKSFPITIGADTVDEPATNETFTVTISSPAGGATLGAVSSATVSIVDDDTDPPGALALSAAAVSVNESAGTAVFTVTRSGGANGAVSASFATANGTATAGSDYVTTAGTVNFASGETSKNIVVAIINDAADEPNETFTLQLSAPTGGATLGAQATATATIVDDDGAPLSGVLSFSAATYTIAEDGVSVVLTVNRSGGTEGTVGATVSLTSGTATASEDFAAGPFNVSLINGQTSGTVSILINDDGDEEDAETFTATLSAPTGGATLGAQASAEVSIEANDHKGGGGGALGAWMLLLMGAAGALRSRLKR